MLWWTIQDLAVAALLAGMVRLLCFSRRIGPAWRHAMWLVVLLKLLTPPLVAGPWSVGDPSGIAIQASDTHEFDILVLPSLTDRQILAIPPPASRPAVQSADLPAMPALPPLSASPLPAVSSQPGVSTGSLLRLAGWIWLIGAVAVIAVQCVRIAGVLSRLKRSRPADGMLAKQVIESAGRLGIRPIQARVVAGIDSPLVWSFWNPQLLWPAKLPEAMSEDSLRGLIVHELAHVKRRDHWVGWLELIAACVWWWNPLFWYVRHQLRENAELACDAWVVNSLPRDRRAYAEALLAVCEAVSRRTAPLAAVGVNTGGRRFLERRLAMIMRERAPLCVNSGGIVVVCLLALVALPTWAQRPPAATEPAKKATPNPPTVLIAPGIPTIVDLPGQTLTFDPPVLTFGKLSSNAGPDPTLTVIVTNVSGAVLTIAQMQMSPELTTIHAPAQPITLQPDEKIPVTVALHLSQLDMRRHGATIWFNTGPRIFGRIAVSYDYDPIAVAATPVLAISQDYSEPAGSASTIVTVRHPAAQSGLRAVADTDQLLVKVEKSTMGGPNDYLVSASVAADHPLGIVDHRVDLFVADREDPVLSIPVHCNLAPRVDVRPGTILLGTVAAGQPIHRRIVISSVAPFHIAKVLPPEGNPGNAVTVNTVNNDANKSAVDVVFVPDGTASVIIDKKITIQFDSPGKFEIEVPVIGEIAAANQEGGN